MSQTVVSQSVRVVSGSVAMSNPAMTVSVADVSKTISSSASKTGGSTSNKSWPDSGVSTQVNNKSRVSKKRKRSGPFRIKVGCVVTFRYRPGGNRVTLVSSNGNQIKNVHTTAISFSEVWTDPQPGRDEGLALIGRRVRCCFPKSVSSQTTNGKKASTRMLEGEIVSILDNHLKSSCRKNFRWHHHSCRTTVELLVDSDRLLALPFLQRTDESIDISKLSESAKRAHLNEQRIRGKDKVMVKVVLDNSSGNAMEKTKEDLVARWVIRKRVPSKLPTQTVSTEKDNNKIEKSNGAHGDTPIYKNSSGSVDDQGSCIDRSSSKSEVSDKRAKECLTKDEMTAPQRSSPDNVKNQKTLEPPKKRRKVNASKDASLTRYVGDGNDSTQQQEKNWRWQAGRYTNISLFKERPIPAEYIEYFSFSFIGEVLKVQPAATSSSTLALVTVKRLVLPEHTESGRMPYHSPLDMYDDLDMTRETYGACENENESGEDPVYLQLPIEELVILSRRVKRDVNPSSATKLDPETDSSEPLISHAYTLKTNKYVPLSRTKGFRKDDGVNDTKHGWLCHRCRREVYRSKQPNDSWWCCKSCTRFLKEVRAYQNEDEIDIRSLCDCRECHALVHCGKQLDLSVAVSKAMPRKTGTQQNELFDEPDAAAAAFRSTRMMLRSMRQIDFGLPPEYISRVTTSAKPIVRVKTRNLKKPKKVSVKDPVGKTHDVKMRNKLNRVGGKETGGNAATERAAEIFRPTASRLLPYNTAKRKFEVPTEELYPWTGESKLSKDKPRNLRLTCSDFVGKQEKEEKTMNSRAARANQRRLMRDIAAIGVNLDTLTGREQQLRFDRSRIHAWGVFADEDIREGEMLIEYRGEIIGNAMAEKREKEYENAKIGSDYMFRIDALSVCDATKQGNVARFINASCDPNCYTKIISIDGSKRIAVYAKRDIGSGEELCYDYKFPLEYDETRRIPCHCGARDCRGFMNWDKRYVIAPPKEPPENADQRKFKQATNAEYQTQPTKGSKLTTNGMT